jgi:hypothetical protein
MEKGGAVFVLLEALGQLLETSRSRRVAGTLQPADGSRRHWSKAVARHDLANLLEPVRQALAPVAVMHEIEKTFPIRRLGDRSRLYDPPTSLAVCGRSQRCHRHRPSGLRRGYERVDRVALARPARQERKERGAG